jgi:hypothetical protein
VVKAISSRSWRQIRGDGTVLIRCVAALLFMALTSHLRAQTPKEYQLKAVLLWRLAQYVDFPKEVLGPPEAPIVIAVLGSNPFGDALRLVVKNETAHGRKLEVRELDREDSTEGCHIIFVSQSERARVRRITSNLRGRSVLTVSDIDTFAELENGMVRFAMENNKVTLQVNLDALNAANLKLDSRVLRMARIVKESSLR